MPYFCLSALLKLMCPPAVRPLHPRVTSMSADAAASQCHWCRRRGHPMAPIRPKSSATLTACQARRPVLDCSVAPKACPCHNSRMPLHSSRMPPRFVFCGVESQAIVSVAGLWGKVNKCVILSKIKQSTNKWRRVNICQHSTTYFPFSRLPPEFCSLATSAACLSMITIAATSYGITVTICGSATAFHQNHWQGV